MVVIYRFKFNVILKVFCYMLCFLVRFCWPPEPKPRHEQVRRSLSIFVVAFWVKRPLKEKPRQPSPQKNNGDRADGMVTEAIVSN